MSHVTYMNESRLTLSDYPHMNESCDIHELVMTHPSRLPAALERYDELRAAPNEPTLSRYEPLRYEPTSANDLPRKFGLWQNVCVL